MAALFQRDIVVISHPVIAMHGVTFAQQKMGKVIADKASGAGDEDTCHALPHFVLHTCIRRT